MLPLQTQVRKAIWTAVNPHTGIRRIDEAFPHEIRENTNDTEMFIRFKNGATWQCVGSDGYNNLVGAGVAGVTFSEWALCNPSAWGYIRPMIEENDGWAAFITTPRGRNHAKSLYDMAKADMDKGGRWFAEVSSIQDTGALSPEQIKESMAEYIALYGEDLGQAQFEQEYNCFKPDALVMCHDRARPISDIREGDSVLTHTGRFRRVDSIMSKEYSGDMMRISAYGSRDIICTPEHPVYVCNPSNQTYTWVDAKDIKEGEWLVTPKMNTGMQIIPKSLAKVIAWYVCEGCVAGNNLTFSIGWHEPEYVDDLVAALTELSIKSKVTRKENVACVSVNNTQLADFLVSECGSMSHNKRIPIGLIRGNEGIVWETLFKGDGCIHIPSGSGRWRERYVYSTISEGLAQQVQIIGSSLGFTGSYTSRENSGKFPGREKVSKCRTAYTVQMTKHSGHDARNGKTRMAKNGALGRVRSVTREEYSGPVHNISVAGDESYVVNARAVHNCSFNAAILGAYYAKEMLAVRNDGRIDPTLEAIPGKPVHRAWDIGVRDDTSIWWFQIVGAQVFILDCYSKPGVSDIAEFASMIRAKNEQHGWTNGKDYVPHDARQRVWGMKKGRLETMIDEGLDPHVVDGMSLLDGINATRRMLPRCVFHTRCDELGITALEQYQREWDDQNKVFRQNPKHNWASHLADAARYMALAYQEERPEPIRVAPSVKMDDNRLTLDAIKRAGTRW